MNKNYQLARNVFLEYILTENPTRISLTGSIWNIYVLTAKETHYIHYDFFKATKQLKDLNFDGFIYECYCLDGKNINIEIRKVI